MGKPLVRFCEGQEFNCDMVKILWHRRESRRKQRKQTLAYRHGSLLSTRKPLNPWTLSPRYQEKTIIKIVQFRSGI